MREIAEAIPHNLACDIEQGNEERNEIKQEIEEGLEWIGLNWGDLEFANEPAGAVDTENMEP